MDGQLPEELPSRKRPRFTLVELMVLISILGVLVTVLVPVRLHLVESARRTSCAGNIQCIGMAMSSYAGDYDEGFPCIRSNSMTAAMVPGEGTRSLALLYPKYLDNSKTFSCPSKWSNWQNFELPGFAALPNSDPRLKWSTSYWYDYRHRDGQLSTIVLLGDAATDTGWSPTASGKYYRPASHGRAGGLFGYIGARSRWIYCVRGGTKMAGDAATDPNVYTRDTTQAQHDTCLVN